MIQKQPPMGDAPRRRGSVKRRAASEMFAASSKLSATIRAFSSPSSPPALSDDHLDTTIAVKAD
jgi:hypothetical protein